MRMRRHRSRTSGNGGYHRRHLDKYMVSGNLQNVTNDAANPRGRALAKGRVTPFNATLIEVKKA